jgi:hypothetical protein
MYDTRYGDSMGMSGVCRCVAVFVIALIVIPVALAQTATERQSVPSVPTAAPKLEISASLWDFGEKWAGEKAETTITLRNVGKAPLEIGEVKSSCGCTVAKVNKKLLQPGASEEVRVTYDTNKRTEKVSQKIRVHSNDPDSPVTVIEVKGQVKQLLKMSDPRGLSFGAVGRDDVATKAIEIECNYTEPLELTLEEPRCEGFDVQLDELEAGKHYRLTATTKPPLRDGPIRASVQLVTGVELVPEVPVRISGNVQAPVTVAPTTLYVVEKTQKTTQYTLRVTSRRQQPLKVTGVVASDPAIKVEILPMPTLPAKAALASNAATIRVTLPPADEIPADGATITITTDDQEYAELVVPVRTRLMSSKPSPVTSDVGAEPKSPSAKPGPPKPRKGTQP